MINVALLGCGTVGSGVVKLLNQNSEAIARKTGAQIRIAKVLEKDAEKCYALGLQPEQIARDFAEIVQDKTIDIVVELMGGMEPAFSFITEAMQQGKHVVSANKDLIAEKGKELFAVAEDHQVDFYFEASVAGGIPIVYPLKQSLAGNRIMEVIGILNGTTNYILSKMSKESCDYQEALYQAQQLGYAEADPAADVEGMDAARKIAILSSIAFNSRITLSDVYVEGITAITLRDIQYARDLGFVVKLLAIAKEVEESQVQVRVHPAFVPFNHPLAFVNDVYNAVFVKGDAVGEIMHYGQGAGSMPTASAVVGDIIEIGRSLLHHSNARIGCTCFEDKPILPISELNAEYYIRMTVADQPGVLAGIAGVFGQHRVSIAQVLQKTSQHERAELILITHLVKEKDMQDALTVINGMSIVDEINSMVRLEGNHR